MNLRMLETLNSWQLQLGSVTFIVLAALYVYFKTSYSYWEKRGIPTLKPTVPFGNFSYSILSGKNPGFDVGELYKAFDGHKIGGLYRFSGPSLLLRDTEIIKDVLVKNFDHFYSRGRIFDEEYEPLDAHLFHLSGTKWRNLRVKLTPLFTTRKMKMMFGTLVACGKELQTHLQKPAINGEIIEINDILARYSTDVIGTCAFGIQCNCLKNPDAEFRKWGKKVFDPRIKQRLTTLLQLLYPSLVSTLKLSVIPKDVSNYFGKMVKETVEYREKNKVERNDFMQLMIQLKNKTLDIAEEEDVKFLGKETDLKNNAPFEISVDVIAAQAYIFFVAGFETSSATMTFCLYELALNPDIQERVRSEINAVLEKYGGNITYESIFEMKYLDKVVNETLRKYPSLIALTRDCTKPIKLRGTDLTLEKGVQVVLPVYGLHHDPKYYPDPERFDPERFSDAEIKKRPQFSFLPFGEGPRICIGMRFGLMQTKVGIISFLANYEVQMSDKTPARLAFDQRSIVLAPDGGVWLKIAKAENRCH